MVDAADAMTVAATNQFLARRHTWKSTERMAELAMPVLLVNGRWESAFQEFVDQAVDLIPKLQVVSLEGGHAINAEQPEQFNAAVITFISDLD
jgi:pimeloyl-ACP methyl ester carboxylesterase